MSLHVSDSDPSLMFDVIHALSSLFVLRSRLQAQESMWAQSQTCVQELTTELRNRCLELRELRERIQDEDKLVQVRAGVDEFIFH